MTNPIPIPIVRVADPIVKGWFTVQDGDGNLIYGTYSEECAGYFVRALSNYDILVEALREILSHGVVTESRPHPYDKGYDNGWNKAMFLCHDIARDALTQAQEGDDGRLHTDRPEAGK